MGKCSESWCVRCSVCVVRWLPVCFIFGVVGWAYYAYVFQLCFHSVTHALQRIIYLVVFHILLVFFLWSYYKTVFSPIGRPQKIFYLPLEVRRELQAAESEQDCNLILDRFVRQHQIPVANRAYDGSIRFCHKCYCVKPDRSHHCSVCGQCVLKFDHHCPWVNTCVNYRNYKFFVQFLGYGLLFCLWGFFTDMQYFIGFWKSNLRSDDGLGRFHILFLFFVSGMFAVSLSCLFFYHLYLTAHNQSTIESFRPPLFTYGPDKSAYNLGVRRNFTEIFGRTKLLWFLPVFSSCGDGVHYQVNANPDVQQPSLKPYVTVRQSVMLLPSARYANFEYSLGCAFFATVFGVLAALIQIVWISTEQLRLGNGINFLQRGMQQERYKLLNDESSGSEDELINNIV